MNESNSGHVQRVQASRNNGLREWPLRSLGVCAAAIVLMLVASPRVLRAQTLSTVEQEVWNREISYWDLRAAGKIDQYMALWHENFIGWPGSSRTVGGKSFQRERIEAEVRDTQPGSFTTELEPLAVRLFGNVAEVFYRAHSVRVNKAGGRVELRQRVTHTWLRTAGTWTIIAGMSSDEPVGP